MGSVPRESARVSPPLTLSLLREDDLGIGAEVLPGEDHLLAAEHGAAVQVLLLHHGKLVSRALSCRVETRSSINESGTNQQRKLTQ